MRFGLFGGANALQSDKVTDSQIYTDFVDYVCEAEELGFDSVFLVEHHFTGMAQISASLNFLTFLAAKTTRMRLGTAVVVLPWHNPVLLAEQVATLDLVSGGRFDFGIGRGYRQNEFDGFGISMDEADERFEENLEVLRKGLGSTERWSHHGKRWKFDNALIEPPTVQKPHPPFWVGAGSDRSIIQAANRGFNLLLDQFGNSETTGHRISTFRNAVESAGGRFDPQSVGLTRALHVAMNDAEREMAHMLRAKFLLGVQQLSASKQKQASSVAVPSSFADTKAATEESALIGTPDEIIRRLKALEAVGVQKVLMLDVGGSREALRVFAREVMPEFSDRGSGACATAA
ncbi:alkanesulfonate monooxygenase SsuD/methylene tetrahydromethanopterin reductase-like flavin-dependent oxidoreductase (luciferase family) [Nitrobacteraceae bacterium AZCC 2161]